MSDLQLALLAMGAAIVGGVILYNWWQERRLIRENSWRFNEPENDALMEEFRIDEKPLDSDDHQGFSIDEPEAEHVVDDGVALEDVQPLEYAEDDAALQDEIVDEAVTVEEIEAPATESAQPTPLQEAPRAVPDGPEIRTLPAGIDANIDLIGIARFGSPTPGSTVYQALQSVTQPSKPMQCFVQDVAGNWRSTGDADENATLRGVACALQLADCNGPVSQPVVGKFREEIGKLAGALEANLEWLGPESPSAYAAELDQFCMEVDVMVGFHLIQGEGGTMAGTKLRGLAEAGGMQLHTDGAFHFENDTGETLFTMVSQDQRPFRPETLRTIFYRGLSFQLDVPRVSNCSEAFNQMVLFARNLEASLGGQLVDDNHRPLGETEIGKIRQQLKAIQARMEAHGIVAGSAAALRLFS